MKFQEAIISVINDYGKDILLKSSIINILRAPCKGLILIF